MSKSRKIDIHTHILPPKLPDWKSRFGYGGFMQLQPCAGSSDFQMVDDNGKAFRKVQANCINAEVRIKECDAFGISLQVLSTIPVMFSYWAKAQDTDDIARFLNDHIATIVQEHPKRFAGLGTVALQDPQRACREVQRGIRDLGLKGFQIGSHIGQWNLSATELFPFYETCEKEGAVLFVHPWDMMGQDRMPQYWLPWLVGMPAETSLAICSMIFGGVFERFPRLRVAFAHGGGSFPFTLGRVQHGFEARPDLCAVDSTVAPTGAVGKFWVDSLVHDTRSLQFLIQVMGREKICLGSDYPFPLGEDQPGKLIANAELDSETEDWLNHRSAAQWLGID